ncbi:MAG: tetratricopeptide repeat protein, partial [Bacteroidota bacterium]
MLRIGQSRAKINSNYQGALSAFDAALTLANEIGDDDIKARCYGNIAIIYIEQNSFQAALEYSRKQQELWEKLHNEQWIVGTLMNIAEIYFEMDSINKAEEILDYSDKRLKVPEFEIEMLLKYALIRERQNRYSEADSLLNMINERIHDAKGLENYKGRSLYLQGKMSVVRKQPDLALQYLNKALYFFSISAEQRWTYRTYEIIALAYEQKADFRNAYAAASLAHQYHEKVYNKSVRSLVDYWSKEQNRREAELLLEEQNLRLDKETAEKRLWMVLAIFLVAFVLTLVYFMLQRAKHSKSLEKEKKNVEMKNELLQQHQHELAAVNAELKAQHEEIAAQRDLVLAQKSSLEHAQRIIEAKNEEISLKNENLEKEVYIRTKEIVEYNQQLEQFAFMSAHNLRGPVARILGLGHLLELPRNTREDVAIKDKLIKTTRELDKVVNDLNTILEIRNDHTKTITEVDLEKEVREIEASLEKEIAETQTKIETDFTTSSLRGIKPYIDSILLNLISNAIKYRHPRRAPEITIRSNRAGEKI